MPRRGLPEEGAGEIAAVFKRQDRRLRMLEMPTGEQLARALEKVQQLITDLPGLVAAAATSFLSTGFTTGSMTATGDVTSATGTVTGAFHNPNIITNQITTPRTSVWAQDSDGLLGWASSSRTQKDNIRDSGVDPRAVLQISSVLFNYKAELEKHALDPEYVVADEFGAIAEDLHDLGLGVVVDYWPDGSPRGINYTMLGLLAVEAAKHLDARLTAVEGRLDAAGL